MLTFPRLTGDASIQYPISKTICERTVVNNLPDGHQVKTPDNGANTIEWELTYTALSDNERKTLEAFFAETEGSLQGFVFLDPVGNLLEWSEQLDQGVWEKAPLLQVSAIGTVNGRSVFQLRNTGGGPQLLQQTTSAPRGGVFTFSVWARTDAQGTIDLVVGGISATRSIGSDWRRVTLSCDPQGEDPLAFGLVVPAGQTIETSGFQVEAQASASGYRRTSARCGVYLGARFKDDTISFTSTDVNRNSARVTILYADHI